MKELILKLSNRARNLLSQAKLNTLLDPELKEAIEIEVQNTEAETN